MNNQKFREQVADLILKDDNDTDLVVVSNIFKSKDGSMFFLVGEDSPDGLRYMVTVQIEEVFE